MMLTDMIQSEVNKVVLGKEDIVRKILTAILAEGHVLLEDVPGVGKTTLAMAFSRAMGLSTKRVQFTSDTMPSDIIGFSILDKQSGSLKFQPGAVMTNVLLADEINRTSSKTQSALLEVMEEKRVTVDGVTRELPRPFIVLATQNPVGSAGTQILPPAQMDRFLMRLTIGYPDRKSQIAIMRDRHHDNPLDSCRAVATAEELMKLSHDAMAVYMSDEIYDYIAEIAEQTRLNPYIALGVSPRGALALCRAAKAAAFLNGRDYVITDDVVGMIPCVIAHRLILDGKAKLHEYKAEQILENVVSQVQRPDIREFRI